MKIRTLTFAALILTLPGVIAAGEGEVVPAEPCSSTAGRDVLTPDGYSFTFEAPLAVDLVALNDAATSAAFAPFHFVVDVAPYPQADVTFTLDWAEPSDFDLYLYDEAGALIDESYESNLENGNGETIEATLADCAAVQVLVSNWSGAPQAELTLDVAVAPTGDATPDVAPRPADTRTSFYLAGDRPGQGTTTQDYAGTPLAPTLTPDRPTNGDPDQVTRPVVGFADHKNPFLPWWSTDLNAFPEVEGSPSAIVWVSSPTQQQDPGTLLVQLFVNGAEHTVEVPGSEVGPVPTPILVEFPPIDEQVYTLTLQVATVPTVSTSDPEPNNAGDATHTVWYHSVQYPARVLLPTTCPVDSSGACVVDG